MKLGRHVTEAMPAPRHAEGDSHGITSEFLACVEILHRTAMNQRLILIRFGQKNSIAAVEMCAQHAPNSFVGSSVHVLSISTVQMIPAAYYFFYYCRCLGCVMCGGVFGIVNA